MFTLQKENMMRQLKAYENVINEPEVTLPIRNAALFTLAQLNLVQENIKKVLS